MTTFAELTGFGFGNPKSPLAAVAAAEEVAAAVAAAATPSIADMFDGGGPGASGDSFSNVDNTGLDTDGDGHISSSEAIAGTGSDNLSGGIDGSNDSGGGYQGPNIDGSAGYSFSGFDNIETDDNGYITSMDNVSAYTSNNDQIVDAGRTVISQDQGNDNMQTNNTINNTTQTTTNTTNDTSTTDTSNNDTTTDTSGNDSSSGSNPNQDLLDQIADLQRQLDSMSSTPQVVYESTGSNSQTGLPDDYLTAADLEKYLGDLNTSSNAYDPAAFLNAYGFAMQPGFEGDMIRTYLSPDGLYMRRAVRDRDTGEIRYINVPIGSGAINGNTGLNQWRENRRTGFGTFV